MNDLLQTSTSCDLKICLKSHTTGTTARRDPTAAFLGTVLFYAFAEDGTRYHYSICPSEDARAVMCALHPFRNVLK